MDVNRRNFLKTLGAAMSGAPAAKLEKAAAFLSQGVNQSLLADFFKTNYSKVIFEGLFGNQFFSGTYILKEGEKKAQEYLDRAANLDDDRNRYFFISEEHGFLDLPDAEGELKIRVEKAINSMMKLYGRDHSYGQTLALCEDDPKYAELADVDILTSPKVIELWHKYLEESAGRSGTEFSPKKKHANEEFLLAIKDFLQAGTPEAARGILEKFYAEKTAPFVKIFRMKATFAKESWDLSRKNDLSDVEISGAAKASVKEMPGRPNAFTINKSGKHTANYLREKFGDQVHIPNSDFVADKMTVFVEPCSEAYAYFANIIEHGEKEPNEAKNWEKYREAWEEHGSKWQDYVALAATTAAVSAASNSVRKAA